MIAVTAGQAGDSPMLPHLLAEQQVSRAVRRPRTSPDSVRGDRVYSSRAIRTHLRDRGITAVIPEPADEQGHRKRRGSLGGRPASYDTADHKRRNVIERRFCHLKRWRGLATRYEKDATTYRAVVVLNAVIAWTQHLQDTPLLWVGGCP